MIFHAYFLNILLKKGANKKIPCLPQCCTTMLQFSFDNVRYKSSKHLYNSSQMMVVRNYQWRKFFKRGKKLAFILTGITC